MTKSKRNILIISVSILLIAVIAMAISFGVLLPQQAVYVDKVEDELPNIQETPAQDNFTVTPDTEYGIALTAASGDSAFSKTLTATVLPADTPNKAVDWSVAWAEDAEKSSEPVTNYVTVTPASDGALTATVRCIKAFGDDKIVVTVKTRTGGYTATCIVDYKGLVQTITINTSGKTSKMDNSWNKSMLQLDSGTVHTFDIKLDNDLHSVGSNAADLYLELDTYGSMIFERKVHLNSDNSDSLSTSERSFGSDHNYSKNNYVSLSFSLENTYVRFCMAEIEDGKLKITTYDSLTAAYGFVANRGGYAESTFKGFKDNKVPYGTIKVIDKNTGVSAAINIQIVSAVTGVSVSLSTMTF